MFVVVKESDIDAGTETGKYHILPVPAAGDPVTLALAAAKKIHGHQAALGPNGKVVFPKGLKGQFAWIPVGVAGDIGEASGLVLNH